MRIALILPGFSQTDHDWAIPALLNLAKSLARQHELHVFSQRYPAPGVYYFAGLTHQATGGGQNFGAASLKIWSDTALAVIREHRRQPFDLLHAFWADEAGLSAAAAGTIIRRPVVVSLGGGELTHLPHIDYGAQRFLVRRLTTALALRRASIVTAGSRYQLDLARSHRVPAAKLRLMPLGVDLDRFQPAAQPPPLDQPVLVQAASLLPVKNQSLLLETVRRTTTHLPQLQLRVAGSGPERTRLHQLAIKLNLARNIIWTGPIPYLHMAQFFQMGHLYLQSSHHESQGMAVLEAMACGLPALGTPVGVLPQVTACPSNWDPATLAAQIQQLLHDPAAYQTAKKQARQTIHQSYSLTASAAAFATLYRELTE